MPAKASIVFAHGLWADGLAGHANTNEELVAAARAQIAGLAASEKTSG